MSKFIGYTIGLECWKMDDKGIVLAKVEFSELSNGKIKLHAVSGNNLGSLGSQFSALISREDYDNRPYSPYNDAEEAIWALSLIGLTPTALESHKFEAQMHSPDATLHNPSPDYIRALIERSGLSQREAARRIGISERLIRYYVAPIAAKDRREAPYPVQYALEGLASGQSGRRSA